MRGLLAIAAVVAAMALSACGGTVASKSQAPGTTAAATSSTPPANLSTSASPTAPARSSSPSPTASRRKAGVRISVRSSPYGRILRDGADRTIYLFTHDLSTRSTCYGACASAWPPVLTRGVPAVGSGLNPRLLSTSRRRDGTLQVTYGAHPLYYYVSDVKPGQILCQNVDEFGGTWLIVSPQGTAVR